MSELFSNPDGATPITQPATQPAVTEQVPVAKPEPVDPNSLFANQLAGIVADDGRQKYSDVTTALASIPHAQGHIQTLTTEVVELKAELAKRAGAEDLMERLQKNQSTQQTTEIPSVAGLDETQVRNLLDSHLEQKALTTKAETNRNSVKTALSEKFGDRASDVFASKAASLGLSVVDLTNLAASSPQAAMELFKDVDVRDPQPTTPSSNTMPNTPASSEPDYMAKFKGHDTSHSDKWAKAKAAVALTLNGE